MRRVLSIFMLLGLCASVNGQDLEYVKRLTDTLTSESYHGRGYVNNGGKKTAQFIAREFRKAGLRKIEFQKFSHSINSFPGKVELVTDGKQLVPAVDFLVNPMSNGCDRTKLKVKYLRVSDVSTVKKFNKWKKKTDWASTAVAIEREVYTRLADKTIGEDISDNAFGAHTIINLTDQKLTWTARDRHHDWVALEVLEESFPKNAQEIEVYIEQHYQPDFQNQNVLAMIKGSENPDSFIVFTAHYDHLGRMGESACFYGANDNAGGAAMLCDLARHYGKPENRPRYSILFIAFGAEEAGLIGSKHYVENPKYPLSQISLLINLDLVTTGQDGIMVVNGRVFKHLQARIKKINEQNSYVSKVKGRPKAANSDHYWFSENGVRAIFIYLLGDYPYYHDINDTADQPTWAAYDPFFKLLTDLVKDCTQ